MIYTTEKGSKIILMVFLISFSFFVVYFLNEVKKIESVYEGISIDLSLE
jgi:hypothetical protein